MAIVVSISEYKRVCGTCGEEKSGKAFSINGGYVRSYCKTCANEASRRYKYKHRYGVDHSYVLMMLQEQNYKCKICGKPIADDGTAHTDHDHKTNKMRGLLCLPCNNLLGLARDSVSILVRAAQYLVDNK